MNLRLRDDADSLYPAERRDGARCAFLMTFDGEREADGFPKGFARWSLFRRASWLVGFDQGFCDRMRLLKEQLG